MSELKPCPFCGGKAVVIHEPFTNTVHIECISCGATSVRHLDNEKQAIKKWNRRVTDD